MKKLSKKLRLERAVQEAEEHGKVFGIRQADDWVYSIAFHWGFEEDIPAQKIIAEALLSGFDNANMKPVMQPDEFAHLSPATREKKVRELWRKIHNKIWDGNPPPVGRLGHPWKRKRS